MEIVSSTTTKLKIGQEVVLSFSGYVLTINDAFETKDIIMNIQFPQWSWTSIRGAYVKDVPLGDAYLTVIGKSNTKETENGIVKIVLK